MAARLTTALIITVLLTGCVTETYERGALVWVDSVSYGDGKKVPVSDGPDESGDPEEDESAPPPAEVRKATNPDDIVDISEETLTDMIALINRPQYLLADRIEVDATRVPFKPALIPLADPTFVTTEKTKDLGGKANGFVLESLAGQGLVERECPRLRVGDGIDCMASQNIRVRYHRDIRKSRPVFIRIRATGNAVYRDLESGERLQQDAITITAELVQGSGGLVLRHAVK